VPNGGKRTGQRRHGRPLGPVEARGRAATRHLGQRELPPALFVAAAELTHRLAAQANGLTGRLLADTGGQGQQRLRATHCPHGSATRARKVFEGSLVSR